MKTIGLLKYSILICLVLSVLVFSSCRSCGNRNTVQTDSIPVTKEDIKEEVDKVLYPIPSPYELTKMLNSIKASYIYGITNEVRTAEKYITVKKQALNIGIYSSDLAYSSTYNIKQETLNYLNSIKKLTKDLDMTAAVDENIVNQINTNIDDKNKLSNLITDLFYKTYAYLKENGSDNLGFLILAGTWIEGIYLATHLTENTMDNAQIIEIIAKQADPLKKIIELMDPNKSDDLVKDTYENLIEIKQIYDMQGSLNTLTKAQMEKLNISINRIRADIIK